MFKFSSCRSSHQCRDLLDEARDYHLMPERRPLLRSFKSKPRCCKVKTQSQAQMMLQGKDSKTSPDAAQSQAQMMLQDKDSKPSPDAAR